MKLSNSIRGSLVFFQFTLLIYEGFSWGMIIFYGYLSTTSNYSVPFYVPHFGNLTLFLPISEIVRFPVDCKILFKKGRGVPLSTLFCFDERKWNKNQISRCITELRCFQYVRTHQRHSCECFQQMLMLCGKFRVLFLWISVRIYVKYLFAESNRKINTTSAPHKKKTARSVVRSRRLQ